jgi:CRISPR-associated protein Cas2
MARDNHLRILCYDISCDRRRRAVARLLEDAASRVQFSVFETRLSSRALKSLTTRVERHLADGDSLRVYTIHRSGERHCEVFGTGVPIENEAGYWLL